MPNSPPLTPRQKEQLRRLVLEQAKRRLEAIRLFRPMPVQEAFLKSKASERILRGSNRAGKTVCGAVELVWAVTGQHPFNPYPQTGKFYVIGKQEREIREVVWPAIGRAGAFKIVKDPLSGLWRAYLPNSEDENISKKLIKPAPPLLPPRFIKNISWLKKKAGVPALVILHNGWEIVFFSSESRPPMGSAIDGVWLDEETLNEEWYPELAARLVDRQGRLFWTCTPQAGTAQLFNLHEEAEKARERNDPEPRAEEFHVHIKDNVHIPEKAKKEFAAKLRDDEYLIRFEGEYAVSGLLVYPEFSVYTHLVEQFPVPNSWTRYMVVDPGRQICAVLFAALPPPDHGDYVYLYDELYIRNCTAELFGKKVHEKVQDQSFQAFLIDHHGGRVAETAGGRTIEEQYAMALSKRRIASCWTGSQFIWGASDIKAGLEATRAWLAVRSEGEEIGTPRMLVFKDRLPYLVHEIKKYRYKRDKTGITDVPEKRDDHLCDCLRYLALYNPRYVEPEPGQERPQGAYAAWLKHKAELNEGNDYTKHLGPPVDDLDYVGY